MVSFEESLKRTIEWQRFNPPVNYPKNRFNYVKEDEIRKGYV